VVPLQAARDVGAGREKQIVNSKPDPRVRFEPDPADGVRFSLPARRDSWFPTIMLAMPGRAPARWLTRSSRGLSWNRAGLISSRDGRP